MNIFNEYKGIEYYKIKYKSRYNNSYIIAFVLGFLFIIFVLLSADIESIICNNQHILLDRDRINDIEYFDINYGDLYINIFITRFIQFVFIYFLSKSKFRKIIVILIYNLYGIYFGILILFLVYCYGIRGIILLISLLFPQFFLYFFVFMYIFDNSFKHDTKYYHNNDENELLASARKHNNLKIKLWVIIFFMIGTLLEAYVNPIIVRKVIHLF